MNDLTKELLEALKRAKDSLVAFKFVPGDANRWEESDEESLAAVNSAIAAADARQERLLQDMHDAGLEIDRVMAEPTMSVASQYFWLKYGIKL